MEKAEIESFPNRYSRWMGSQGPDEYTFQFYKQKFKTANIVVNMQAMKQGTFFKTRLRIPCLIKIDKPVFYG